MFGQISRIYRLYFLISSWLGYVIVDLSSTYQQHRRHATKLHTRARNACCRLLQRHDYGLYTWVGELSCFRLALGKCTLIFTGMTILATWSKRRVSRINRNTVTVFIHDRFYHANKNDFPLPRQTSHVSLGSVYVGSMAISHFRRQTNPLAPWPTTGYSPVFPLTQPGGGVIGRRGDTPANQRRRYVNRRTPGRCISLSDRNTSHSI